MSGLAGGQGGGHGWQEAWWVGGGGGGAAGEWVSWGPGGRTRVTTSRCRMVASSKYKTISLSARTMAGDVSYCDVISCVDAASSIVTPLPIPYPGRHRVHADGGGQGHARQGHRLPV